MALLRWFLLFLVRLGSPSGCRRFGLFPRVLVSRWFSPCWLRCFFVFLVVFIGGFGRSVWPSEWLRFLWLSAVFGEMSHSSAVEASVSCWPVYPWESVPRAPIACSSCESVSVSGVEFHGVGVWWWLFACLVLRTEVLVHLRFIPCLERSEVVKSVVQCDRSVGEFGDLGGPCGQQC